MGSVNTLSILYEEERKKKIIEYLQLNLRVSVRELSSNFSVSESTIRRDLQELEDENKLKRTHGGAVYLEDVNLELTFGEKEDKFRQEKVAIAKKAAELIEDGDTILIDSGTTTLYMVNELRKFSNLTVVTNSIILAQVLQGQENIQVVVVGGMLRKNTLAMVGPMAEQALGMLNVNKAFIGTNGLSLENGLTTPNIIEAATKTKMISIAKQVVVLTDWSKFGKVSFAKFAELSQIDTCIVDDKASPESIEQIRKAGIEVEVVYL
ncbi:MAG: transcriptional regulator, DeoR family [Firmicutes bacterium]|nr:transcriptional regulator, DeoR family [Bacillota bacterium]